MKNPISSLPPEVKKAKELYSLPLSSLFERLEASASGLGSEEAERRRARWGANEPAPAMRKGLAIDLLRPFANPLIIILLAASLISAFVGELVNAVIVAAMILISVGIGFFQTHRSQRTMEALRKEVAPTATVLRGGKAIELPRREIVPGDVIQLSAGDLVPADARLIQSHDLHVQEAALTGESLPTEKSASDLASSKRAISELSNTVFLGSSVISGTALALAIVTGSATFFGDIIAGVAAKPPETEFDRGTKKFGYLIMKTVFALVIFVFLVNVRMHRDVMESLLFAVALAVGLTPEFLPMITSVTLAQGAIRMAGKQVVVKNLAAIENFGSIDILCSDKTGTLTTGVLSTKEAVDPQGKPSEDVFRLAYLNSLHETGIRSPLDTAILASPRPQVDGFLKVDEMPFDFERRRLSVVLEHANERLLITKGAPESVLPLCHHCRQNGEARPLEPDLKARCEAVYRQMSAEGLRLIAVASKTVTARQAYAVRDENELTLEGFVSFYDPPRPEASATLEALRRDGIDVKILTGDSDLVARHVCTEVGLDGGNVVLGNDLDRMTDTALTYIAERTRLFARVSPAQKNRILHALKARGHVVGFLGDGINDAPSLHSADVGISVSNATDVAKDAASIILLKRDLGVLHNGIIEGRKAFGNVMKYLLMGTSSNFGNMFSMAGATLLLPFLPMLPMQILLNNLLYDLAQITIPTDRVDPTFIRKPRRWDVSFIRNFMLAIGPISSLYDFLTFYILLHVFHASEAFFHTGWFMESLITQTLVVFVIRTAGNPLRSPPSLPLMVTVVSVVIVGILLPYTPLGSRVGLVPLPAVFFVFLLGATATYLLIVQAVKALLMPRLLRSSYPTTG